MARWRLKEWAVGTVAGIIYKEAGSVVGKEGGLHLSEEDTTWDLVNHEITYVRTCDFVVNEFIKLIHSGGFWTEQKDLELSCFSLSPNVTTLDRCSREGLGIDCLCRHALLLQAGDLHTRESVT